MNPVKQAILDFVANNASDSSIPFELAVLSVASVDVDKRVLDAADSNNHLFHSLALQFIGGSVFLIPAVGSNILALVNQHLSVGYVISCSKIESAEIVIGETSAIIDADGLRIDTAQMSAHINKSDIIFNGGDLNGLVIIQKLTDKLNELVAAFNGHTHTGTHGPTSAPVKPANTFNKADYENTKIKQ